MHDISAQKENWVWGKGENYQAEHFCILSSHFAPQAQYDVLIFTDSRGFGKEKNTDQTWIEKLSHFLDQKEITYLIFSRPKNLTVAFTLINFLENNPIKFNYLITNIGFVDFTPKKQDFIEDIILQNPTHWKLELKYHYCCHYTLQEGINALFSLNYADLFQKIASFLENQFRYSLLIGTMEFSEHIQIERKRPKEFFSQIKKTNEFLFETAQFSEKIHYLQPLKYPFLAQNLWSFDAVHFTASGHQAMFDLISPFLHLQLSK